MFLIVQIEITDTYCVIYIDSLPKDLVVQIIFFVKLAWMSKNQTSDTACIMYIENL